jgi:flagella basal body P-ring formation protein FlgA
MTMQKKIKTIITIAAMAFPLAGHAANWQYVGAAPTTEVAALAPAADAPAPYFTISRDDVEKAVAEYIKLHGEEAKTIHATMDPGAPILHAADHALKISLQALQVDRASHRWQAQAYIVGNRTTEIVRPVSGRYETIIAVPVLTRQFGSSDVIEASDIEMREIPERLMRKDTVTRAETIIGKSPIRMISASRPIRTTEIAQPTVVKKGQAVEMTYTTPSISIRDSGEALEDGAQGAVIRVKNSKTGKAVTARVEGAGHVEVNTDRMM